MPPPIFSGDSCTAEIYNAVRSEGEIREPHEENKLLVEVAIVAEEKKPMWAPVKSVNNCNWQKQSATNGKNATATKHTHTHTHLTTGAKSIRMKPSP